MWSGYRLVNTPTLKWMPVTRSIIRPWLETSITTLSHPAASISLNIFCSS